MAEHSNMRDNTSRLRRNMSKLAYRGKEKVLRSFGRVEETKDEILDHYVMLINKQQIQMQKLHRDMKQYLQALKAMGISQKVFYDSLYEVYDDDWAGKDVISSCSQRSELLHNDIFERFQAEVVELLQNHLTEYQKCKLLVEKRGRKLVDYDAAKRALQSLESARKPDEEKLERAKDYTRETREMYEELNTGLHHDLPSLYDSRLSICVNVFSSIHDSEKVFSNEVSELRTKLDGVLQNLKLAYDGGEYHIQRMQPPLDNGRVAPASQNDTPSVSGGSPVKHATSSTVSSSSPVQSKHEAVLPARSPDDEVLTSPNSDPSTHEYVNLQVGTIPDVVSEEGENAPTRRSPEKSTDIKKIENEYLSPNVNNHREDIGYIMATDICSIRKKSAPIQLVKPRPSARSHIFRNPSDSQYVRAPIPKPKPLPRTLSAPAGERPNVKRQQKHPSLQGRWRVPRKPYTDVHPQHNNQEMSSSSSTGSRQDRPENKKRPASMYAPRAAAGLSLYEEDKQKAKDDGSGSTNPNKSDNLHGYDTAKSQPRQDEGKQHKGLFGFLGLKRLSKSNKSPVPASPVKPEPDKIEEQECEGPGSASAATAAIAGGAVVASSAGDEKFPENEHQNRDASPVASDAVNAFQKLPISGEPKVTDDVNDEHQAPPSPVASSVTTLREVAESSDDDVDSAFAKYGGRQKVETKGEDEREDVMDSPLREDEVPPSSVIKDPVPSPQTVEVEAEVRKLSMENGPVFSVAVNSSTGSPSVVEAREDEEGYDRADMLFGDVDAFGDGEKVPFDEDTAFGSPGETTASSAFNEGFADAFVATSPGEAMTEYEVFSTEPFSQHVPEDPDVALAHDDSIFEEGFTTKPENFSSSDPFVDAQPMPQQSEMADEERIYENIPVGRQGIDFAQEDEEGSAINKRENDHDLREAAAAVNTVNSGAERSDTFAQNQFVKPAVGLTSEPRRLAEKEGELGSGLQRDQLMDEPMPEQQDNSGATYFPGPPAAPPNTPAPLPPTPLELTDLFNYETPMTNQEQARQNYLDMTNKGATQPIEETDVLYEDVDDVLYEDMDSPWLPEPVKPLNVDLSDDEDQVQVNKSSNVEAKMESKEEFPTPDGHSKTANGDTEPIQPIYEEPPREDSPIKSASPANKSPTKSFDSHKYLDLPPNYLFSVQALYQYRSSDDDELTFDKGEIIHIVVHPDPAEQDDGWQMGMRKRDWEEKPDLHESFMGVFPENFTKRIQL